ncbi:hypothetical protein B0H19DRAFT_1184604 [Mycena capillaripes]|nr:hypothetical protein B0H19DRAFT_1184604 [Mycena capillaripes]
MPRTASLPGRTLQPRRSPTSTNAGTPIAPPTPRWRAAVTPVARRSISRYCGGSCGTRCRCRRKTGGAELAK